MRGAFISMKNVKILVKNPPVNGPNPKIFAPAARSRVRLLFLKIENLKFKRAFINISKISRNAQERLLRGGGVYCQLPGIVFLLQSAVWLSFQLLLFLP